MPLNNEPFHHVKQSVQSMQDHILRMSGLAGGLCGPSKAATLGVGFQKKIPGVSGLHNEIFGNNKILATVLTVCGDGRLTEILDIYFHGLTNFVILRHSREGLSQTSL